MPESYAVIGKYTSYLYCTGHINMSRRKSRYERRKKKREENKEKLKQYDNFDNTASIAALFKAAKKASNGVFWKASVQRYILNILFRCVKTHRELIAGKDIRKGFIEFDLCERGKLRHIKSVHFEERVVQKSICDNALYPILTNSLIYDNAASQKGKGTHFAENRLVNHLRWFLKHYGRNGYILLIDFKGYFDSIPHEPLKDNFRDKFSDSRLIKLADDFVDAFGEIGLGLGSETSQINAIAHINKIDHYIKEVEKVKCYGRYMDDSYIILPDKDELNNLYDRLKKMYQAAGVIVNENKTQIISLKHCFKFLKTRFFITSSGRIVKKPCRERITKERRKLKRQAALVEKGIMTVEEVLQSYQSWKGSMQHRHARKTIRNMDILYNKLFKKEKEK